jgi:hypothetical protein
LENVHFPDYRLKGVDSLESLLERLEKVEDAFPPPDMLRHLVRHLCQGPEACLKGVELLRQVGNLEEAGLESLDLFPYFRNLGEPWLELFQPLFKLLSSVLEALHSLRYSLHALHPRFNHVEPVHQSLMALLEPRQAFRNNHELADTC